MFFPISANKSMQDDSVKGAEMSCFYYKLHQNKPNCTDNVWMNYRDVNKTVFWLVPWFKLGLKL